MRFACLPAEDSSFSEYCGLGGAELDPENRLNRESNESALAILVSFPEDGLALRLVGTAGGAAPLAELIAVVDEEDAMVVQMLGPLVFVGLMQIRKGNLGGNMGSGVVSELEISAPSSSLVLLL